MNMLAPKPQATQAPTPAATVPDPIRVVNPTDPDAIAASRLKADEVFRNRRGRESTRLAGGEGSSQPYSRTTLG